MADQLSIEVGGFPTAIRPMQAVSAEAPFSSDQYFFEVRWDGLRCLLFADAEGRIRLQDRSLADVTFRFPEFGTVGMLLPPGSVLDGVLVVTDPEGRPDPQLLRDRLRGPAGEEQRPASYLAFDILYIEGRPVLRQPLRTRKKHLARAVTTGRHLYAPKHIDKEGVELFEACLEQGLAGVVAKHRESFYVPGQRSPFWLQIEAVKSDNFVVVGWTGREPFEALLVAFYEAGRLLPCGSVGGGFDPEVRGEVARRLGGLRIAASPLQPPPIITAPVSWCRPELVVNVRYSEWATDGTLRFPIFNAVRTEVHPAECVRLRPRVVIGGRSRLRPEDFYPTEFPFEGV